MREIYRITNKITGQWYVGCSINAEKRFKNHVKSNSSIGQNIKLYGVENFTIEVLEKCEVEKAADRECHWEQESMKKNPKGRLNGTMCGSGTISEETCQKISKALKGKPLSEETKKKISKALKGNRGNARKVKETTTDTTFDSIGIAAEHFNINGSFICWCCRLNAGDSGVKRNARWDRELGTLNFVYFEHT